VVVVDHLVGEAAIDDDVVAALRRAAAAVPAAALHPREPVLRLQARRRLRITGAAIVAAAAVIVLTVLISQVLPGRSDGADVAMAGDAAGGEPSGPVVLPLVHAELLPDGSTRPLPLAHPDDAPEGDAVRLPDGRLVTLVSRERGDAAVALEVFDRNDELLGEHDVARRGADVSIAGVAGQRVVLVLDQVTGVQVSTVDPTTFEERRVADVDRWHGVASAMGDRMVLADDVAASSSGCTVTVLDLATEDRRDAGTVPCLGLTDVAISPDGKRAALVIERRIGITAAAVSRGDILDRAVAVIDLDDGKVVETRRFDATQDCSHQARPCPDLPGRVQYRGMAWTDAGTIELVVQDPGPRPEAEGGETSRLVAERLRTMTIEVD